VIRQDNLDFTRLAASGFEAWRVSIAICETLIASQAVISTRLIMVSAGMLDPRRIPYAELSRMIPEKSAAFGKAHSGAVGVMMAPPGAAMSGLSTALLNDSLIMFHWWELMTAAAGAWWKPVHARATANNRRLQRRRIR
jgi:hypothetical protein